MTQSHTPIQEKLYFGCPVINIAASDFNPIKNGFFVRWIGTLCEYTDGKGYFARTPPSNLLIRSCNHHDRNKSVISKAKAVQL